MQELQDDIKILLTEDMYGLQCRMYNGEIATITRMVYQKSITPRSITYRMVAETNVVGVDEFGINGASTGPEYPWNVKEVYTREDNPEFYL